MKTLEQMLMTPRSKHREYHNLEEEMQLGENEIVVGLPAQNHVTKKTRKSKLDEKQYLTLQHHRECS